MAKPDVSPELQTSPVFRIRGQKSRWRYPEPQRQSPEDAVYMRDINISEFGSADTRYGYTTYNASVLTGPEAVVGLIQEKFSTGTHQFVITPTKIYHDTGTVRTDLTGALTLNGGNDARTRHAFIKDQIVGTNGVNATWVKDNGGATGNATALSGVPWTKCQDLVAHKGLLVALNTTESGTNYPTRIRWCDINTRTFVPDITVWRSDSRYEVYDGGPAIVGGVDNWTKLLIFKEDGMYPGAIQYDVGYLEFRLEEPILRGFHPIAKQSLIARPEFVFGVAKEGPFVIRPDFSFELLSRDIQDEWNTLTQASLQYAVSFIREKDHQVRTLLAGAGTSSGFDLIMVWDWETNEIFFDRPSAVMNFGARVVLSDNEQDWLGSRNGYVYKGNLSTYEDDNGTGIAWQVRMAPNDLGSPGVTKYICDLITIYRDRSGADTAVLTVTRDQGVFPSRSKTLDLTSGELWDSGLLWNTGVLWGGGQNRTSRFFVNRTAENIAPEWSGDAPASLVGYQVTYSLQEP